MWAGRRRRGRSRCVACWSARFGDAWAQATRHKPQAEASPACRQGNAHARSRRNYSVFWHRAAAAKQRHTRKLPARQGVQWVGRRAPSGIDRAKQEACHRSVHSKGTQCVTQCVTQLRLCNELHTCYTRVTRKKECVISVCNGKVCNAKGV